MTNLLLEPRRALQRWTPLRELVGIGDDYKVFDLVAPPHAEPPYIVIQFPPNNTIAGVYGDSAVMEALFVQLTAWAPEYKQALQLADLSDDAMLASEMDAGVYEVISVRRATSPLPMWDPEAKLYGVVVRYELVRAR